MQNKIEPNCLALKNVFYGIEKRLKTGERFFEISYERSGRVSNPESDAPQARTVPLDHSTKRDLAFGKWVTCELVTISLKCSLGLSGS